MSNCVAPVLVAGRWRDSEQVGAFQPDNPSLGEPLPERYPISSREEALKALNAASEAAEALRTATGADIAEFFEQFAAGIRSRADELICRAHLETGLAVAPRLKDAELPRTIDQVLQGAAAARDGAWRRPVRDQARNLHSLFAPLGGAVVVMAPNNFPFAFNSAAGGDFIAAIVAQNPVIAKSNPGHPGTTRVFAEIAHECVKRTGLHPATVQLLYQVPDEVGLDLVSHPLVGATGFTGSRPAGLKLKAAADRAGKPIYLEMSSVNPVVILDGALIERGEKIAEEFVASCTLGAGQFCTRPGLILVPDSTAGRRFIDSSVRAFEAAPAQVLLGHRGRDRLSEAIALLTRSGAKILCGGVPLEGRSYRFQNTLLAVSGGQFLREPQHLQTEAFGPVGLIVTSRNLAETVTIVKHLQGNLTGTIYSDTQGKDEPEYEAIEPHLRHSVGRLINDKMPTGVTVSPAMNHGGPFPATGHPGFTSVGFPASIRRFAALHCYDNVPLQRLPAVFQDRSSAQDRSKRCHLGVY